MEAILIPVKPIREGKRRLANSLTIPDRRRLQLAMLADVLRAVEKFEARFLVTSDPDAEAVGIAFGCQLLPDPQRELNQAIREGTEAASNRGCTSLLVIPCDVPLVTGSDLRSLFSQEAQVAVVASRDGGTNALLRRPPSAIDPAFGSGSAAEHLRRARAVGLQAVTLSLDSLAFDVDGPPDLVELASRKEQRDSVRVARDLLGIESS